MEAIIHYLNDHYTKQPSLDALAAAAGLSPGHFQRKFTAWVGVSPKAFLQHLTFRDARERLLHGESVDHAAWDAGLSGPSRLHDLCVVLEAASPGEIKRGGAGLTITYGYGQTPFGSCLLGTSARGIVQLSFVDRDEAETLAGMQGRWPQAELVRNDRAIKPVIDQVFRHQAAPQQSLRAYVQGTKFQLRVWRALLEIPPGKLLSYGQLATSIGRPSAARAVGTAVGANPLAYLIPCHRVIRASGVIGGYRWGLGRKQIMIASELASSQV
ncbi:MAG: methylated DNA-protein cysteine methyltransferase [Gammaproteobacteria bacterium]|nr:methylated DNA-protein cysteine methyltransferase [Gammaproteobacteria bacterium]